MAIITQYHKDTKTTYVYESISYWDTEKQQSRSKRKCIGKIDPETGETIPTGKRGRKKTTSPEKNENELIKELNSQLLEARSELTDLKTSNAELSAKLQQEKKAKERLLSALKKIQGITSGMLS